MVTQDVPPPMWDGFCSHFTRTRQGERIRRLELIATGQRMPIEAGLDADEAPATLMFRCLRLSRAHDGAICVGLEWVVADRDRHALRVVRPILVTVERERGEFRVRVESSFRGGFCLVMGER